KCAVSSAGIPRTQLFRNGRSSRAVDRLEDADNGSRTRREEFRSISGAGYVCNSEMASPPRATSTLCAEDKRGNDYRANICHSRKEWQGRVGQCKQGRRRW